MSRRVAPSLIVACCFPLLALAGTPSTSTPDPTLKEALAFAASPEKGKVAYETCRGCHKADASGRPEANYPQLAGQHSTVLIKQMLDTRSGQRHNPRMHPFIESDSIAASDIPHIAAYLNSLPTPKNIAVGSGLALARGQSLYVKDCASCHGARGEGDAHLFRPRVAPQHYPYLYRETLEIRNGTRRNADAEMVKALKPYSTEDIEAVSDYMARLTP